MEESCYNSSGVSDERMMSATPCRQSALLDLKKRRIWCFGPHPDSKINFQRFYLPVRFLCVLRSKDVMILPGNHLPTREFVDFMLPLLGLSKDQIIWTSGEHFALDEDINEEIQGRLRELILTSASSTGGGFSLSSGCSVSSGSGIKGSNWVLVPYSATKTFVRWSSSLTDAFPEPDHSSNRNSDNKINKDLSLSSPSSVPTLEVFGESEKWNEKYGHKGILHRHMRDLSIPAVIEEIDENADRSNVPKGYQCSNTCHLLRAYEMLMKETMSNKAVIKPIFGTAGFGIIFIDNAEDLKKYDFPMGEVLLEEMLDLDMTEDGLVISPAVHYIGEQIFGEKLVDQLMISTTYLGWRESKADMAFQKVVMDMTRRLIKYTNPQGPGGYDFLSVNGQPVLSDVNTGRFNGAHQPKLFLSQYASPGSMWYCWKHKPKEQVTMAAVWAALSGAGLAYIPIITEAGGAEGGVEGGVGGGEGAVGGGSVVGGCDKMPQSSVFSVDKNIPHIPQNVPQNVPQECKEGVFPLTYLRGIDGMFIAIAGSSERAHVLYEQAKEVLASLEKK